MTRNEFGDYVDDRRDRTDAGDRYPTDQQSTSSWHVDPALRWALDRVRMVHRQ